MARIKRHQNTSNHQGTKCHLANKCRYCNQEKHHDKVVDSILRTIGRNIGCKIRQERHKYSDRISKLHNVEQCPISKDLSISYLQKYVDSKGIRKSRKYIKKALDFGVESGYLIPFDPTYRILRVSSDLTKSDSRRSKISTCDMNVSKDRDTLTRLENLQERRQKSRRRRRQGQSLKSELRTRYKSERRRRRRSGSRRGRRRYSSPQNPEEVAKDEADDYEMDENDPKSNIHTDNIEREPKTARSNQPDEEQSM